MELSQVGSGFDDFKNETLDAMRGRLLRIQDWERLAKEAQFRTGIMAARCPIGLRQLERFFTKQFNKSPKAWTKELRMRIARELLEQGWFNKAVANELGFANESHFCHEFKKFHGTPPQTFAPFYALSAGRTYAWQPTTCTKH